MKYQSFKSAIFGSLFGIIFVLMSFSIAWGYGNAAGPSGLGGPHRMINELALAKFIKLAAKDQIMSYYDFEPSFLLKSLGLKLAPGDYPFMVDGKTIVISGDWFKNDVSIKLQGLPWVPTYTEEQDTTRAFKWWIIEGGYTADEPESYMALRHFFDPTQNAQDKQSGEFVSYLTDDLDPYISPLMMGANPRVNAKVWVQSKSPYSLDAGSEALGNAFSTSTITGRRDLLGKAWRCIGESMHLLADMTVPAHVRNDSHPGALSPRWENIKNLKSDPYEDYVTAEEVADRVGYSVDPDLQSRISKCSSVAQLFDLVSKYTNSKFFSTDTISGSDAVTKKHIRNFNAQAREYASPKLDSYTFKLSARGAGSGYYTSKDGALTLVRRDADGRNRIDRICAMGQANRLIPIAIAANIKLLDCLVPKVKVEMRGFDMISRVFHCRAEVVKRGGSGKYEKTGFGLCPSSGGNVIVYTKVGGKKNYWLPITKINGGDFEIDGTEFYNDLANAVKNDKSLNKIYYAVGMDMGGIIVKSDTVEQPINRQQQSELPQSEPKKLESLTIDPSVVKISDDVTMLEQVKKCMRISLSADPDTKYLTISDMGSTDAHIFDSGHPTFGMYCKQSLSPGITWSGASFQAHSSYIEDEYGDQHRVTVEITGQLSTDGKRLLNIKGTKKSINGNSTDTINIEAFDVALKEDYSEFVPGGKPDKWSVDWTYESPGSVGFTPYTVRGSSVTDAIGKVTFDFGLKE